MLKKYEFPGAFGAYFKFFFLHIPRECGEFRPSPSFSYANPNEFFAILQQFYTFLAGSDINFYSLLGLMIPVKQHNPELHLHV